VITAQAVDQCVGGVHGGDAGDHSLENIPLVDIATLYHRK
jgi:hypothetical protein